MKLSTSAPSQRQRIIDYLTNRTDGATTLDMVKDLDVLRPGARICELRQAGHHILTHWTTQDTPLGSHKVVHYVLIPS